MATYSLIVKLLLSHLINILCQLHNANAQSNHENPVSYLARAFNQPFPTISLICVSSKEKEDITKSFKIKNSHGYDGISTKSLKLSVLLL